MKFCIGVLLYLKLNLEKFYSLVYLHTAFITLNIWASGRLCLSVCSSVETWCKAFDILFFTEIHSSHSLWIDRICLPVHLSVCPSLFELEVCLSVILSETSSDFKMKLRFLWWSYKFKELVTSYSVFFFDRVVSHFSSLTKMYALCGDVDIASALKSMCNIFSCWCKQN